MELFVLRHAIAFDAEPGQSDSERRLTEPGKQKLRRVLERARSAELAPAVILSSPYVRARETADIARQELGHDPGLVETANLVPHGDLHALWDELRAYRTIGQILVVGHNPLLADLVNSLVGSAGYGVEMKKAALASLQVHAAGAQPRGSLSWLLTAKTAG